MIGTCWRELGPKLDMSASKIKNLDEDDNCSPDKANTLLLVWKHREESSAVAGRLADALESIGERNRKLFLNRRRRSQFIALWSEKPCLFEVTSSDYSNRLRKDSAFQ